MHYKLLYILHGWTYELSKWNPLINKLKKAGYKPKILNIPGLTDKTDKSLNINDYIDWLYHMLPQNTPIILLGHSNGGRIALNYALKYPDKISRLILIDSAGIYDDKPISVVKRRFFKFIAKTGQLFTNSIFLKRLLYKLIGEKDYVTATPHMKNTMINLMNSDKNLNLENLRVPTAIIWGGNDRTTPLWMAYKLRHRIRGSTMQIIQKAGHSPQFSHFEQVYAIIHRAITGL